MDQKRTKYDPIDDVICAETVMLQAVQSLDIAAYMAIESRDYSALAKISKMWTDMARMVGSGQTELESDGEDHPKATDKPKRQQTGFTGKGD